MDKSRGHIQCNQHHFLILTSDRADPGSEFVVAMHRSRKFCQRGSNSDVFFWGGGGGGGGV